MNIKILLLGLALIPLFIGCGEGDESSARHNQGRNCLSCHSFTSGATVFQSIDAMNDDETEAAQGYMIQLLLDSGEIIMYANGNGYGNVLYNGDQGVINDFTAQIIDSQGVVVNQSSVNSHHVGRLACNSCHTQEGLNGAPGRIVNFDVNNNLSSQIVIPEKLPSP